MVPANSIATFKTTHLFGKYPISESIGADASMILDVHPQRSANLSLRHAWSEVTGQKYPEDTTVMDMLLTAKWSEIT